jgi:hypothetical protein
MAKALFKIFTNEINKLDLQMAGSTLPIGASPCRATVLL